MSRTAGTDFLNKLHDGRLSEVPSAYLEKTRDEVSMALEELLDVGARIRPLRAGNQIIGWVRGVHLTERRTLKHWVPDDLEAIEHLLRIGTTLTPEDIRNLTLMDMRSLARVIRTMTDSDLKLYPYIPAFVSTSLREQLWFSKGAESTSFHDREVAMPDGKAVRILAASDQGRLRVALCNARIRALDSLEASSNAVLIIRPWAGKGADRIASPKAAPNKNG